MSRKPKFSIVGPSPQQLAGGQVIPSVHQILTDARVMLADEMSALAALREGTETGDEADLERSAMLTKNALMRMDALQKGMKIAALIREETDAAQREKIAGMDLSQMTDIQLRELMRGMLEAPSAASAASDKPDAGSDE